MRKFIVGALVALAATATAAYLSVETDAPQLVVVLGAVFGAVAVPLGAYGALAGLMALLPPAARAQISIVLGTIGAALTAVAATTPTAPGVKVTLVVLTAIGTAAGIWNNATSLENPKAADGTPLVPVDAVEPGMPRKPTL